MHGHVTFYSGTDRTFFLLSFHLMVLCCFMLISSLAFGDSSKTRHIDFMTQRLNNILKLACLSFISMISLCIVYLFPILPPPPKCKMCKDGEACWCSRYFLLLFFFSIRYYVYKRKRVYLYRIYCVYIILFCY